LFHVSIKRVEWHNFKIAVGSDRIVKFYVDNELIYTSKKRINETVLQEKKIFLGIRSSGSAGNLTMIM